MIAPPPTEADYSDERVCVCLSVCLSVRDHKYLWNSTSDLRQFSLHFTYGLGSIFIWRRSDMLCTPGFMDDVIFAHRPRLLDVAAQMKHSAHAALGLAKNKLCAVLSVAGQRTQGTTFRALKVTSQVATQGAEFAVYGCFVTNEAGWSGSSLGILITIHSSSSLVQGRCRHSDTKSWASILQEPGGGGQAPIFCTGVHTL